MEVIFFMINKANGEKERELAVARAKELVKNGEFQDAHDLLVGTGILNSGYLSGLTHYRCSAYFYRGQCQGFKYRPTDTSCFSEDNGSSAEHRIVVRDIQGPDSSLLTKLSVVLGGVVYSSLEKHMLDKIRKDEK